VGQKPKHKTGYNKWKISLSLFIKKIANVEK